MIIYRSGEWYIDQDNYGIDHGTTWGLWRGKEFLGAYYTLGAAKRGAAREGQTGEWTRSKVRIVEGKP